MRQGAAQTGARPGDLVVLAPGRPHHYGVEPDAPAWRFWWVHCQARPSWTPWLRPYETGDGLHAVTPTPAGLHGRVEAAFRRMLADARWTGGEPPPPPPPPPAPPGDRVAVAHTAAARELALSAVEEVVLLTAASARPPVRRHGVEPGWSGPRR